jgi:hypothetical protein
MIVGDCIFDLVPGNPQDLGDFAGREYLFHIDPPLPLSMQDAQIFFVEMTRFL